MKSNRQARRLLGVHINNTYRISNRRWLVWGSNCPFVWEHAKPSRRQRRSEQRHFKWLRENADYSCDYAQEDRK